MMWAHSFQAVTCLKLFDFKLSPDFYEPKNMKHSILSQGTDLDDEAEALAGAAPAVRLPHDVVGAPNVIAQQGVHPARQVRRHVRVWEWCGGARAHKRRVQKSAAIMIQG